MPLDEKQKQRLSDIDKQIKQILSDGGDDEALFASLSDFMVDIKKFMDVCSHEELNEYCKEYDGFFHCVKLMEKLAQGIADGSIPKIP